MAKTPTDELDALLRRQDAGNPVAALLELAKGHAAVHAHRARMQPAGRPDRLAADFRKTLAAWRRSPPFYGWHEAGEFGRMLEVWLEQVARGLLPRDPPAALALFEAFIEADAAWFERADDSNGAIGDAMRCARPAPTGCRQARAARRRPRSGRNGCRSSTGAMSRAPAKHCCSVPTCCSTGRRCGSGRRWRWASSRFPAQDR